MDNDLLVKTAVIAAFLGLAWVLPDWARYRERARRVGESLNLVEPAPPSPPHPPIERIAADAQRIGTQIRQAAPGAPVARMRGWVAAYDDVLITACRALELDEQLGDLRPGTRRDLERQRVERMLMRAGFPLVPAG